MDENNNVSLDAFRRRYSAPFEAMDTKYKSGFKPPKSSGYTDQNNTKGYHSSVKSRFPQNKHQGYHSAPRHPGGYPPAPRASGGYPSGRSTPAGYHSGRSTPVLLSKVDEDAGEEDGVDVLDPFEEFHLSPERRMLRSVNSLRWRVDGSGRNRAQSLVDEYIDQVTPEGAESRLQHNRALQGIHQFRRKRRSRRKWSIFPDEDDENQNEENTRPRLPPLARWRRTARIVRMLCAVCIALRKYAMDAGLMENYMVNVTRKARTSGDPTDDLTFNLKDFKIRRELNVPVSIIRMMEKNPDDRTEPELVSIGRMMKNLPSFRKYTSNMQRLFCKIVRYTKCGKRRIVLRKGHLGYNLYFIYSGAVSVVLDKDEGNVFVKPEVVVLRKGACFGEIALLQRTRRNATVVCTEESELLFVEKEDFLDNGLHLAMDEEFEQRYNFFRTWKSLESWSDQKIRDLSYVSRMEEFNHNKVIVKDSKKNEWLWFIIRGSCDVLRLVDLEKCPEYRKVVLHGHKIEEYLVENSQSGRAKRKQRNRLKSTSNSSSRPIGASTPDIKIQEPSEGGSTSSSTRRSSFLSSEPTLSKSSIGSSMYSQAVMEESEPEELTESESGEDDDLIPRGATIKEINPMEPGRSGLKSLDIGQGIFVKVDELRDGQCFGIEYLFDDLEKPVTLSLVSKGCEVIHVPRSRFHEMSDAISLTRIQHKNIKSYPDDNSLCAKFLEINQWDSYKSEVLEGVMTAQNSSISYQDSLRTGARRREFMRMCEGVGDQEEGSAQSKSALALFDANHNSSLEKLHRKNGLHVPRSMTSMGMRNEHGSGGDPGRVRGSSGRSHRAPGEEGPRSRGTSGRSAVGSDGQGVRYQRPQTCPPRLTSGNRLTHRSQLHHPSNTQPNGETRPSSQRTHEARTSRLVALTLRARSRSSRGSRGRSPPGGSRVLFTKSGYKVTTESALASGSQRTIQLVKSVRSPQHQYRMKMVTQH